MKYEKDIFTVSWPVVSKSRHCNSRITAWQVDIRHYLQKHGGQLIPNHKDPSRSFSRSLQTKEIVTAIFLRLSGSWCEFCYREKAHEISKRDTGSTPVRSCSCSEICSKATAHAWCRYFSLIAADAANWHLVKIRVETHYRDSIGRCIQNKGQFREEIIQLHSGNNLTGNRSKDYTQLNIILDSIDVDISEEKLAYGAGKLIKLPSTIMDQRVLSITKQSPTL